MDKVSALKEFFPDFEIDEALKRLANNAGLYEKLMIKFTGSYTEAVPNMRKMLAAGSLPEAEREAHTLKGLAGTFGATALFNACLELEHACKGEDKTAIDAAFEIFASEMASVLKLSAEGLEKLKALN